MDAFRYRIELFSGLRLLKGDETLVSIPSSKVGCLLAYLAYFADRVHARQELAEQFWPETDNSTGRTRLRQHLMELRSLLERAGVPSGSVLRANRDQVSLDPSTLSTDVAEFEIALGRAERSHDIAEKALHVESANALYRGELLPGYHEFWIQSERERLKRRLCGALCELAMDCEKAGDAAAAILCFQHLCKIEPYHEESHCALIRLLIATRQPAAAHRQFKTLERILRTELGESPSVEAVALISELSSMEGSSNTDRPDRGMLVSVPVVEVPVNDALATTKAPEKLAEPFVASDISGMLVTASPRPSFPKRSYDRLLVPACLTAVLLLILFLGYRWLTGPDLNPAHRNYSPESKGALHDELWIRRYESKPGDKGSEPRDMFVDTHGNVYLTGFVDTIKSDVDWLTLKYGRDGTLLWENRYNGTGNDCDRPDFIKVDSSGDVYVTGSSPGTTGTGSEEWRELDIVTVKYDGSTGKKLWEDRYNGPGDGRDGVGLLVLDGAGHLNVFGTVWLGEPKAGGGGYALVRIQYDISGKRDGTNRPLSTLFYPDPIGKNTGARPLVDRTGCVLAVKPDGPGFAAIKYDTAGSPLWVRRFPMPSGVKSLPRRTILDDAGSLYVVNQIEDSTRHPSWPNRAPQVTKICADGRVAWTNIYWDTAMDLFVSDVCGPGGGLLYLCGAKCRAGRSGQFLLGIGSDGGIGLNQTYYGADRGMNGAATVCSDLRNLVHTAGIAHFADPSTPTALNDTTEISTLTYGPFGDLLRVRRYAGWSLLHSKGAGIIRADLDNNLYIAGQTFGGKTNDLFVIKYPP